MILRIMLMALICLQTHFSYAQSPGGPPTELPPGGPPPGGMPPGGFPPLGPKIADAKSNELRVMASGSLQTAIESQRADIERAVKWPLAIQYGAARGGLRTEILAGQDFEVAILFADINKELVAQGKASPKTYTIARVPVALGFRGEGPAPDVSNQAALKQTLLNAKVVRYEPNGAGRPTVDKILSSLGITDTIRDATKAGNASKQNSPLEANEYEIFIFPLSEILSNNSLKNLGPVLSEFQVPVIIEAVIGAHAKDAKAAEKFIDYLRSPAFQPALQERGMSRE